jgi:hypothetical protein|nr:MAG TPA: hypothetical protein [Caudoviricetes sp.]
MLVNIDNEIIKLLRLKEPDVIEGAVNAYLIGGIHCALMNDAFPKHKEEKIISLKKKCIKRLSQNICDALSKDI